MPRYPARRPRRVNLEIVGLVAHARRTLQAGCTRTPLWLFRVHGRRVAQSTIQLQCDNGAESPFAFSPAVQESGMAHRYIKPRRPQQTGKVERSHSEEFWSRHDVTEFDGAAAALRCWGRTYNHERFSMALGGRTPAEKLAAVLTSAPHQAA